MGARVDIVRWVDYWDSSPFDDGLSDGLITRITSVYDSRQPEPDRKAALLGASFAA